MGWVTAEVGRQPWTVFGILPTWMSASSHSVAYMVFSLVGFVLLYSIFIVIEMFLMIKFVRRGPEPHVTGSHHPNDGPTLPRSGAPDRGLVDGLSASASSME